MANNLAKLSIVACARLGGYLKGPTMETPENPSVRQALLTLLTPYVTKQFQKSGPHEVCWSGLMGFVVDTPSILGCSF